MLHNLIKYSIFSMTIKVDLSKDDDEINNHVMAVNQSLLIILLVLSHHVHLPLEPVLLLHQPECHVSNVLIQFFIPIQPVVLLGKAFAL